MSEQWRAESALTVYGWRIVVLHLIGKLLRVHFSTVSEGFGARARRFVWIQPAWTSGDGRAPPQAVMDRWDDTERREREKHPVARRILRATR